MTPPCTTTRLVRCAREAGYLVTAVERPRPTRWILTLRTEALVILAMVQHRPLLGAGDVQDLAELVRVRRPSCGILIAYDGVFSTIAERTLHELHDDRLHLYQTIPAAAVWGPKRM